ncbi:MAG: hypothetical protein ACO263_04955 [Cyclobacteriaceae bacterium]|jgi:hypothetical protein
MKATLSFLLIFSFVVSYAQKVTITKDSRQIKGGDAQGYATELTGSSDAVSQALNKFLKDYGKTRSSAGIITITSPVLGGTTYEKNAAYAVVKGDAMKATAWIGLSPSEWPDNNIDVLVDRIKDMIYQFGVKFYRDQIQQEIDQTQQAIDATDRKLQRLMGQNKDLNTKLLSNEQEKIRLEKSLDDNKNEHVILLQKIEANKNSQDSVTNAIVQIRKVLDAQKERQQKVN